MNVEMITCDHDFSYSGDTLVCKKCGFSIVLSIELVNSILKDNVAYVEHEYCKTLASVEPEVKKVEEAIVKARNSLISIYNIPHTVTEIKKELNLNRETLYKSQDKINELNNQILSMEAELEAYKSRSINTNDPKLNEVIRDFVEYVTKVYNILEDLNTVDNPNIEHDSNICKNNISTYLKQLIFNLRSKGMLINYHQRNGDTSESEWNVDVVATEKTGNKKLDNCVKTSKVFNCTMPESNISIKEEVVLYEYEKELDGSRVDCTLVLKSNGGDGPDKIIPLKTGDDYTLPNIDYAPPPHKIFNGWSKEPEGEIIKDGVITLEGDTTLYAIWKGEPCTIIVRLYDKDKDVELQKQRIVVPYGEFEYACPTIDGYESVGIFKGNVADIKKDGDLLTNLNIYYQPITTTVIIDSDILCIYDRQRKKEYDRSKAEFKPGTKVDIVVKSDYCSNLDKRTLVTITPREKEPIVINADYDKDGDSRTILLSIQYENDIGTSAIVGGMVAKYGDCEIDFEKKIDCKKWSFNTGPDKIRRSDDGKTIMAEYRGEVRKYPIEWNIGDRRYVTHHSYGEHPKCNQETKKTGQGKTMYLFKGWDKNIEKVTRATTYEALFDKYSDSEGILKLIKSGVNTKKELISHSKLSENRVKEAIADLLNNNKITEIRDGKKTHYDTKL